MIGSGEDLYAVAQGAGRHTKRQSKRVSSGLSTSLDEAPNVIVAVSPS
jgi:hypothetical protein